MQNPEKWTIIGINFEVPIAGEEIEYSAKFLPSATHEIYSGLLSVKVTLSNDNVEGNLLETHIPNKTLDPLTNPTVDMIRNEVATINPLLKMEEVNIDRITYKGARVVAKPDSKVYKGAVDISFDSKLSYELKDLTDATHPNMDKDKPATRRSKTEYLKSKAYDSTQTKEDMISFTYHTEFGVDAFQEKYKGANVRYSWKGYVEHDDNEATFDAETVQVLWNAKTPLANDKYDGSVNWNYYESSIVSSESGNNITFTVKAKTVAYASWINAYYSYAGLELTIENIEFIE